jgi:Transglycosylase-like domain
MHDTFTPDRATTQSDRRRERTNPRPDRFAFWAVVMAVIAMFAGLATADAGASGGGIGTSGGGGGDGDGDRSKRSGRYAEIWDAYSDRNHRWARRTSRCESGGDPNAIGGGGTYRGAFQFMRSTWRNSPKTPGGDPIDYNWKTQAVVAVALKKRDGRGHWPVCG